MKFIASITLVLLISAPAAFGWIGNPPDGVLCTSTPGPAYCFCGSIIVTSTKEEVGSACAQSASVVPNKTDCLQVSDCGTYDELYTPIPTNFGPIVPDKFWD